MELIIYVFMIGSIFLKSNAQGWISFADEDNTDSKPPITPSAVENERWNDIVQRSKSFVGVAGSPDSILNGENGNFDESGFEENNDVPVGLEEERNFQGSFEPGWNVRYIDGDNDELSTSPKVKGRRRRFRRRFPSRLRGNNMDIDNPQEASDEFVQDTLYSLPKRGNFWNSRWRKFVPRRHWFHVNGQENDTQGSAITDNILETQLNYNRRHDNLFMRKEGNVENTFTQSEVDESRVPSKTDNHSENAVSSLIEDRPSNFLYRVVANIDKQSENTAVRQAGEIEKNFQSQSPEIVIQFKPENSENSLIHETQETNTNDLLNARKSRHVNNEFEDNTTGNVGSDALERDNLKSEDVEQRKNISEWEKILPRRDEFRVNWGRTSKHDGASSQSTRRHFPIAQRGWKIRSALLRKAQIALEDEEYLDKDSKELENTITSKAAPRDKSQLQEGNVKGKNEENIENDAQKGSNYIPIDKMKDEKSEPNFDSEEKINFINSFRNLKKTEENPYPNSPNKLNDIINIRKPDLNPREVPRRTNMFMPTSNFLCLWG